MVLSSKFSHGAKAGVPKLLVHYASFLLKRYVLNIIISSQIMTFIEITIFLSGNAEKCFFSQLSEDLKMCIY